MRIALPVVNLVSYLWHLAIVVMALQKELPGIARPQTNTRNLESEME